MSKLRVPETYFAPLGKFAQLTPDELAGFVSALREQEPTLDVVALTRALADRLSLERGRIEDIVRILNRLQLVREAASLSVAEFVSELRTAMEGSGKEELRPPDWAAFESALKDVLEGESALAISSKALRIMAEQPRTFCSAQVFTDLRPIFKSDVSQEPAAFVVVHTLKVIYHEGGDQHKEFFMALDGEDLERLSSLLQRAMKKEASLRTLTSEKDILVLER